MRACLVLVLLGALGLLVLVIAGSTGSSDRTTPSRVPPEFEARAECRMAVVNSLKAPSSAEFVTIQAKQTSPGRWTVGGQVDAQNSFGAMIRSHFICEAVESGTGWRVERLEVE